MSKAFTREADDAPEPRGPVTPNSAWSAESRHSLTPDGALARRAELDQLQHLELPRLLEAEPTEEALARRRTTEQRIALLQSVLRSATVVLPPADRERVAFGAEVLVRDPQGITTTYRIVGPSEVDLDRDWINAASPIARVLLGARRGDTVRCRFPAGVQALTIVSVHYPVPPPAQEPV